MQNVGRCCAVDPILVIPLNLYNSDVSSTTDSDKTLKAVEGQVPVNFRTKDINKRKIV